MIRSKRKKVCVVLGSVCILMSLLFALFHLMEEYRSNKAIERVSQKMKSEIEQNISKQKASDLDPYEDGIPFLQTIDIDGYSYIGMLEIPDLKLQIPVMESYSEDALQIAPCCYAGSILNNDCVIAGHNISKHFRYVKNLSIGSLILFYDVEGEKYEYEVTGREILSATQIEEMTHKEETSDWDLTLFTCTPGGEKRCAIRCVRKMN